MPTAYGSRLPQVAAEATLSFLKDTKGALTWSTKELAEVLKIPGREAEQVIEFLVAQGYAQRARGSGEWLTTPAGEAVSGAKPPRFTRESVEHAVDALTKRIKEVNKDTKAAFKVNDAIAFGDFLRKDRARVQAADVGVELARRGEPEGQLRSASDAKEERVFLRQLSGKTALLQVRPYAEWMSKRSHRKLL
jgi:hypothetical protein